MKAALLLLGFLLCGGSSLFALVKIWERIGWLQSNFDEHQARLREICTYVVDANERLWAAGMLDFNEKQLKELGLSHRDAGAQLAPNFRKWDL